ncbi:hypothetical protein PC116_g29607 [Phytophthora cactorum]|nr:hypothetical protein PC116_g29607 [Phytophthora cactorum]
MVERAWIALHSNWLIPPQSSTNSNLRFWIPLRKLMVKARRHRATEIKRLRHDRQVVRKLEMEDRAAAQPSSSGPFPSPDSAETFRERWHQLVTVPQGLEDHTQTADQLNSEVLVQPSATYSAPTNGPGFGSIPRYDPNVSVPQPGFMYFQPGSAQDGGFIPQNLFDESFPRSNFNNGQNLLNTAAPGTQYAGPAYKSSAASMDLGPGFGAWLWADADPSVDVFADVDLEAADVNADLDGEVDWNNWVASANGMNWE